MQRSGQIAAGPMTAAMDERTDENVRGPAVANSLRANFLWTLVGNIGYAACQWGMLVLLAKVGSTVMVGQFALALAILTPVLMFSNLQLRSIQATDAKREFHFGDYMGLRILTTLVALVIIAILAVFTTDASTAPVIIIIGIAKGAEAISDLYYGHLQHHERMDRVSISLLLKGAISLAALAVALVLTQSMLWGAVAMAVANMVVLVAYDHRSASALQDSTESLPESWSPRWQLGSLTGLLRLAAPLGIVMFVMSLSTNIPRYFLEHYQGLSDLGIFAAISYMMVAGTRVVAALGESASPRLAKHYAAEDYASFRKLLLQLLAFGLLLGVATMAIVLVAGRELLTLFYSAEYAERSDVLVWIAVAGSLGYLGSFLGYAMTAARFFFIQAPLFCVVGLTTATACAILVPTHELLGAAWALCLGMIVQVVGSALVVVYSLSTGKPRSQV